MPSPAHKLSAVIITFNEERNIERCVCSLRKIADEIIVLDCYSTDNTKDICERLGVRFVQHEFLGFAKQKNLAASLASHEWVLSLDADEYLSQELTDEIKAALIHPIHDGYTMNRRSSYAGEWIKTCGWYPDTKLRLWKKNLAFWKGESVHEWVEMLPGHSAGKLKGDLLHRAYDNIEQFLEKIQRYSHIYAHANRFKIKVSPFKVFYKTVYAFFKSYILKRGITDGFKGLLISFCNANFVFYKYARLLVENQRLKTSLIITAPQRLKALELTLLSVLNQSVLPDELIVSDVNFRPEVANIIDCYRDRFAVPVLYSHVAENIPHTNAQRVAIEVASGEFIISADSDMILPRNFVKAHKAVIQRGRFSQGKEVPLSQQETEQILQLENAKITAWRTLLFGRLSQLLAWNHLTLSHALNISFWKEDVVGRLNEIEFSSERKEFKTRLVNTLVNTGLSRYEMDFSGFAYHLHSEREQVA